MTANDRFSDQRTSRSWGQMVSIPWLLARLRRPGRGASGVIITRCGVGVIMRE